MGFQNLWLELSLGCVFTDAIGHFQIHFMNNQFSFILKVELGNTHYAWFREILFHHQAPLSMGSPVQNCINKFSKQ